MWPMPIADYVKICLLYTSDAADDLLCVDLGGRRIIKKKKQHKYYTDHIYKNMYHLWLNPKLQ